MYAIAIFYSSRLFIDDPAIQTDSPTRWEVLNTITMKWIDLTVRHVDGSLATTCK